MNTTSEDTQKEMPKRSLGKEVLLRISITLLSTLATLTVFEISFRVTAFLPEYQLQLKTLQGPSSMLHIVLHPELLFTVKPSSRPDLNSLGYREKEINSDSTRPRIMVYGDSFIMANNVDQSETIPAQMNQRRADYDILNFGVSGYGPDQLLLRAREEVPRFNPSLLVLSVFAGNDLMDLLSNEIFIETDSGEVVRSSSNAVTRALPFLRTEMLLRMVFMKRFLPEDTETMLRNTLVFDETVHLSELDEQQQHVIGALLTHVLSQWKALAAQEQIPLRVLVIPSWRGTHETPALFENEELILSTCQKLGIAAFDARSILQAGKATAYYDQAYRHLNARGTSAVADTFLKFLLSDGALPDAS